MKKYLLIGILIGGIVFGSITGVIAYKYNAKDIEYIPKDSSWKVKTVDDAIKDLKDDKTNKPIAIEVGPFELGSRTGITNVDLIKLNVNNYKKLTFSCLQASMMGIYSSAKIYLDNNLIETISDINKHIIDLNNHENLVVNFYSYNNLINGRLSCKVELE